MAWSCCASCPAASTYNASPVVLLTGQQHPAELHELRHLGVRKLLQKPFDPLQLATQLNEIWEREHE